ncbi:hypothetical protein K490DRAFT_59029 [Saccharata proteae CBS 121410]|uniref:BTB domain-containing protein n=1 Tax=Saccharata proteae CBS 121410 TaxID=1314787 RepID=A0A9P4HNY6_9PEZI|nr:hypothetical protein K490DRAFT_59029 [Saccharata proteae CBS 121410]
MKNGRLHTSFKQDSDAFLATAWPSQLLHASPNINNKFGFSLGRAHDATQSARSSQSTISTSLGFRRAEAIMGTPKSPFSSVLQFQVGSDPNPSKLPQHWTRVSTNYPPESNVFTLHRSYVVTHCKRIGLYVEKATLENKSAGDTVTLPNFCVKTFHVFANWLYSGKILLNWQNLPDRMLLIDAYALGCELAAPTFRNKVCEVVASAIQGTKDLPDYHAIMRAYDEQKAPYPHYKLRDLFIDAYLVYYKDQNLQNMLTHTVYPKAFIDGFLYRQTQLARMGSKAHPPRHQVNKYNELPAPVAQAYYARKGPTVFSTTFGKMLKLSVIGSSEVMYIHREFFDRESRYFTKWEEGCRMTPGFEEGRAIFMHWLYTGKVKLYNVKSLMPLIDAYIIGSTLGVKEICNDVCDAIAWYTTLYFYRVTNQEILRTYIYERRGSPLRRLMASWWVLHVPPNQELADAYPPCTEIKYRDPSFSKGFPVEVEKERAERTRLALDDIKFRALPPGRAHGTVHPVITEDMLTGKNQDAKYEFYNESGKKCTPYFGDRLDRFHHHFPDPNCRPTWSIMAFQGEEPKALIEKARREMAKMPKKGKEKEGTKPPLYPGYGVVEESEPKRFGRLATLPDHWKSRMTPDGRRYFLDTKDQLWFIHPRGFLQ